MLGKILMTLSLKIPDRKYRTLYGMWKTLPLAVTVIGITSPATALTSSNLCALMPDADVSAVVGTPVKLSAKPIETNPLGAEERCIRRSTSTRRWRHRHRNDVGPDRHR